MYKVYKFICLGNGTESGRQSEHVSKEGDALRTRHSAVCEVAERTALKPLNALSMQILSTPNKFPSPQTFSDSYPDSLSIRSLVLVIL